MNLLIFFKLFLDETDLEKINPIKINPCKMILFENHYNTNLQGNRTFIDCEGLSE